MTSVGKVAHLKQLLLGMERDLGIDGLGVVQKNIVYVATLLSEKDGDCETGQMRKHDLLEGVSRSAFFRALKDVVNAGYLSHSGGKKRSTYVLTNNIFDRAADA